MEWIFCVYETKEVPMTMHVNLSPEMETFIKGKVASGFYGNATEVIRDAIRRMQAEEARVQAWRAAIKAGDDELDRGEGTRYDAQALEAITKAAIGDMHSGKPMSPDVLP
jgi:antitoxin ParD1/3/4